MNLAYFLFCFWVAADVTYSENVSLVPEMDNGHTGREMSEKVLSQETGVVNTAKSAAEGSEFDRGPMFFSFASVTWLFYLQTIISSVCLLTGIGLLLFLFSKEPEDEVSSEKETQKESETTASEAKTDKKDESEISDLLATNDLVSVNIPSQDLAEMEKQKAELLNVKKKEPQTSVAVPTNILINPPQMAGAPTPEGLVPQPSQPGLGLATVQLMNPY